MSNKWRKWAKYSLRLNPLGAVTIVDPLTTSRPDDERKRSANLRLTVTKLAKAYGFLWALRDLNLDLPPGEFIALLGPNGAGKTTLLKLLAGLIVPTAGSIELDGVTMSGNNPASRRQIGFLTPADHLYENLTIKENLEFFTGLYQRGNDRRQILATLEEVNLAQRADEFVSNLSSGMKCRLSLAKWRLLQPGLLLLDEPYGVLDGNGIDLLESFLQNHCAQGHIVIMASHHVSRALNLCSRALILHHGRLSFNEAKQQPWPSFTQAYSDFLPHGESWRS
ncbi:MAG TPA: heme ABC exporter ATP-binding protein CcmA [Candidatus Binatus sp.]|nr:heme ABC exporter ATP-binding protein CcmA [Candidatus Binatus sp.]